MTSKELKPEGATSAPCKEYVPMIEFRPPGSTEVLRIDETGLTWKGERVDDAGEVHQMLKAFLQDAGYSFPAPDSVPRELVEQAYRDGHSDGRTGASLFDEDADYRKWEEGK